MYVLTQNCNHASQCLANFYLKKRFKIGCFYGISFAVSVCPRLLWMPGLPPSGTTLVGSRYCVTP